MILYIIKSSLCLIVLLGIYLLFLEREKMHRFNRFFLLFALVLGLIIPFINIDTGNTKLITEKPAEVIETISTTSSEFVGKALESKRQRVKNYRPTPKQTDQPVQLPVEIEKPEIATTKEVESKEESVSPAPIIESEEKESTFTAITYEEPLVSLKEMLLVLYAIGFLIFTSRFVTGLVSFYRKRTSYRNIEYRSKRLVLLPEPTVPHTFLNTIYVNKEQFESGELSKQILDHELTHAKQKHSLDVLFIEILRITCWFNPVFYFYKKAIQINHEFLADESVISKTQDSVSYQKLLLDSIFPSYQTSLASTFNYSLAKKRFKMMVKESSWLTTISKKVVLLPLLACIVFVFCTKVSIEKEIYKIDGVEYQEAFNMPDDIYSDPIPLNKVEERKKFKRSNKWKYYDKQGNLLTGEWNSYFKDKGSFFPQKDEKRVYSKLIFDEGRLIKRLINSEDQNEFVTNRNEYEGDSLISSVMSRNDTLLSKVEFIPRTNITFNHVYNSDALGVEYSKIGDGIDQIYVGLSVKYDESENIEVLELYNEEGKRIPITKEYFEEKVNDVTRNYNNSVYEYEKIELKKNTQVELDLAYAELKLNHSRVVAFQKKLHSFDNARPSPPMPIRRMPERIRKGALWQQYDELYKDYDEKEGLYLQTKKDSDLIEYLNLYEKLKTQHETLKEVDSSVKPPRPPVPVKSEQYERVKEKLTNTKQTSRYGGQEFSSSPFLKDYLARLNKYENTYRNYLKGDKTKRNVLYERIRLMYYHERLSPKEQIAFKVPKLKEGFLETIGLNNEEELYEKKLKEFEILKNSYDELPRNSDHELFINYRELRDLYNQIPFYSQIFIASSFPKYFANSYMIDEDKILSVEPYSKLWNVSLSDQDQDLALHYIDADGNAVSTTVGELSDNEALYLKQSTKKSNVTQVYPLPDERKPTSEEIKEWQDDYYFKIVLDREEIENSRLLEMDMSEIHHFKIHKVRWNGNRRIPYDYEIQLYSNEAYQEMIKKYRPNKSMIAFHDATIID